MPRLYAAEREEGGRCGCGVRDGWREREDGEAWDGEGDGDGDGDGVWEWGWEWGCDGEWERGWEVMYEPEGEPQETGAIGKWSCPGASAPPECIGEESGLSRESGCGVGSANDIYDLSKRAFCGFFFFRFLFCVGKIQWPTKLIHNVRPSLGKIGSGLRYHTNGDDGMAGQ